MLGARPQALLLASYMQPGMTGSPDPVLVDRAWQPGQRAWGPAAKCEFISAQALSWEFG